VTRAALASLFANASYLAEAAPRLVDEQLLPAERAFIEGAVPRRRAEFGTARRCARDGFAAMGIPPTALVPGDQGEVRWPPGVVGSISHTADYCAVVLCRSPPVRSVGLDVETVQDLEPGMIDLILTPAEQAWVRAQPPARQRDLTLVFFSAKEAYYKCQYPISKTFLEFGEVELEVFPEAGRFVARALRVDLPRDVLRLEGRFALEAGRIFAAVELT
jgi:4'-phosphopantetheinyl transferase EntD